MKGIFKKINELKEKQKQMLSDKILEVCYSRTWCKIHSIDYSNPEIQKVKELLYKEMIEGDKSYYRF